MTYTKTILNAAAIAFVCVFTTPQLAMADKGGIPNTSACNPGNASFCPNATVPEIGAEGAAAAVALVLGALVLMTARKRRSA